MNVRRERDDAAVHLWMVLFEEHARSPDDQEESDSRLFAWLSSDRAIYESVVRGHAAVVGNHERE